MATALHETEPNPAAKLDLRRVLFELLALQGMNRKLGYTGKVDAVTGQPDPVHEAAFYLRRHPRRKQPRATQDWRGQSVRRSVFWSIVLNVASLAGVTLFIWWEYIQYGAEMLWLIVVAFAMLNCAALSRDVWSARPDLSNDGLYRVWLKRFASVLSSIPPDKTQTGALIHYREYEIKSYSSHRLIKCVTNYRELAPELWRKSAILCWIWVVLFFLAILICIAAIIQLRTDSGGTFDMFFPYMFFIAASTSASPFLAETSLIQLRLYLIEHLLHHLGAPAPIVMGQALTRELPV